jgi:hypothetical protein
MKRFFLIIILFVFLVQNFSKLIIIANYEVNKDYISRVLCENRDKPMMHCNGHCQLKKQLDKEEKGQMPVSRNINEKNVVQYCSDKKYSCSLSLIPLLMERNSFSAFYIPANNFRSVFHPPQG